MAVPDGKGQARGQRARPEARAANLDEWTRHLLGNAAEVGRDSRAPVCKHLRDESMAIKVTVNLPQAGATVGGAQEP